MVSTLIIFGCSIADLNPYSCHNILEPCEDALDPFLFPLKEAISDASFLGLNADILY